MADMASSVEDPVMAMDMLVRGMFAILEDPGQHDDMRFGVMVLGEAMRDPAIAEKYRRVYDVMTAAFRPLVERLKVHGAVEADVDTEYLVRLVGALWEGYRVQKLVTPGLDSERMIQTLRRLMYGDRVPRQRG